MLTHPSIQPMTAHPLHHPGGLRIVKKAIQAIRSLFHQEAPRFVVLEMPKDYASKRAPYLGRSL